MSIKLAEKEVVGNGSTDRVRKLNDRARSAHVSISLERARAYTEVYKTTEPLPPILRRAMATSKALDTTPPYILEGELVIGSESSALKAYPIRPELESNWIMMEGGLAAMCTRNVQPVYSTPEQIKEFEETISPYWQDKTIIAKLLSTAPGYLIDRCYGAGFVEGIFKAGILGTHGNPDWEYIMKHGLNGIKKTAQEKLAAWDYMKAEDMGKNHFYGAVIMEMEAIERFARKYGEHARKLATEENDPKRKAELEQIGEICQHVPHEAPRTFREAIQAFWFVLCAWHLEGNTGTSLNRFDQYMYPFYKKDIDAGILTREEAQEILECLWVKLSTITGIADSTTASFLDGAALFLNTQVGGVDKYGNDATNELSYIIIEALIATRTIQPHLSVRLHAGSPEKFRMKLVDLVAAGMGHPSIYNDAVTKQILLQYGINIADANDYGAGGCMEVGKRGAYWWAPGTWINLGMAVEMAFTNGCKRAGMPGLKSGERLSVETGDPRSFKTYEEFENAVKKHIANAVQSDVAFARIIVELYQHYPVVIQSVLQKSGLERGLPFHEGGAYSSSCPGLDGMGIPDLGNSLAAVKKLVYDEKKITIDQLCEALDHNFEGYEDIRQMCLRAPKYGNDDDYADRITQEIFDWICDYVKTFPGVLSKRDPDQATAQIRHQVGFALAPLSGSVVFGAQVGALPSGRKAGEPLGDSCAPYMGTDVKGPTAALKSVAKIPHYKTAGTITNMYLSSNSLKSDASRHRLSDLIQAYFDQGGAHIQFNIMDKNVLRDAQVHPEKYPNLLVRVAGYSAYFVDLTKQVQDSILSRSEHVI
jgi:formate C-acetyltransferase